MSSKFGLSLSRTVLVDRGLISSPPLVSSSRASLFVVSIGTGIERQPRWLSW
jgi:hypothetical protein